MGVEMVGPESHVALGGSPLTLGYRLSPTNRTDVVLEKQLSLGLTFLEEGDGTESLVETKKVVPATQWNQVTFECGLMVRGGVYHLRLIDEAGEVNDPYLYIFTYNAQALEAHNTVRLHVTYPTIEFDVPHKLETHTANVIVSFGFTKSLCPPLRPLSSTTLLLARTAQDDAQGHRSHHTSLLYDDPLIALQREGRVTVTVNCELWSRNSSYRLEIREKFQKRKLIAKSWTIKVEWSERFGLTVAKPSIYPECRGRRSVRVAVAYPECVLPAKDKIRVYGYQSLPIPSLLVPWRQSYITEQQIQTNRSDGKNIFFPCSLFQQSFSKYCFQYVNTAEDDSVAVVTEHCIPTFPPQKFTDGGWGNWSEWSHCSASCGTEGKRFRYRFCDSPQPSIGGNFCQGGSIEESICTDEEGNPLPPCPTLPVITATSTLVGLFDSPEEEYPWREGEGERERGWAEVERHHMDEQRRGRGMPTSGCECGCILQDLLPGFNYTLVISLTSNHSACEEDEEEHHNLKWILHTREAKDRIRFHILAGAAHCVVLTFRDGNTSDANLLQLFPAQVFSSNRERNEVQTIESTGTSLSIGAADDMTHNCTFPSMYFLGTYHILGHLDAEQQVWNWREFWIFVFLKLSLLVFVVVGTVSVLGGCAKKFYDYKEHKWTRPELDEEEAQTSASRTTSLTLLPFDASYFQRLRLKHFLLHPRKLVLKTHKSLPNTPNFGKRRKILRLICGNHGGSNADQNRLIRSVSLSDTTVLELRLPNQNQTAVTESLASTNVKPTASTSTDLTPKVTSGVGSEMNSLNDLEMDYYDYDIQNAGNIPGSYLLEPSFVFWTDPLQDYSFSENGDQGIELMNTSTSQGGTTSSSMGLFTPEPARESDFFIKETSFDTLDGYQIKFADEEDEDEDETKTISENQRIRLN